MAATQNKGRRREDAALEACDARMHGDRCDLRLWGVARRRRRMQTKLQMQMIWKHDEDAGRHQINEGREKCIYIKRKVMKVCQVRKEAKVQRLKFEKARAKKRERERE